MISSKRAVLIATIAGLATVCLAAALHAEPETGKGTPTPPAPAEPQPTVLAGPKVANKTEVLTIVQRDAEGKLIRLEDRPEIAALPLLKLSGDAKKAADKVVNERGAIIAKALNEHQGLFLQIQSARQSDDAKAAAPLIRELRQKAPQLWQPALLDELAKAIPVEKAATLRSIVGEYIAALAHEGGPDGRGPKTRPGASGDGGGGAGGGGAMMGGGGMMSEGEGGMMMQGGSGGSGAGHTTPDAAIDPQTLRRIEANLVVREMARSLKNMVEMRHEQVEGLLSGLALTPEQDSKIRAMIHAAGSKAKNGQPSREERQTLIEEIKKLLTLEQQKTLAENLKKR